MYSASSSLHIVNYSCYNAVKLSSACGSSCYISVLFFIFHYFLTKLGTGQHTWMLSDYLESPRRNTFNQNWLTSWKTSFFKSTWYYCEKWFALQPKVWRGWCSCVWSWCVAQWKMLWPDMIGSVLHARTKVWCSDLDWKQILLFLRGFSTFKQLILKTTSE